MPRAPTSNASAKPAPPLRRGWTTGACATAASKAAFTALAGGGFPDPVTITLPSGKTTAFALATTALQGDTAKAGVIKDAGDDPDVTHGALVEATVALTPAGSGVLYRAGPGVGTVTKPGLPLPPGEPAINPVPRQMIAVALREVAEAHKISADAIVTLSIPDGVHLAEKTWNPRLGIIGGLSILGTTGIVVPFSCAAWIHSIHRGIDVARASGTDHVLAATGSTSERAACTRHSFGPTDILDMGDFAGGLLKYLARHPVPKLTLAGGFAKLSKLAQGHLDLHSGRSQVNFDFLADLALDCGANAEQVARIATANTALAALQIAEAADLPLADRVAGLALKTATGIAGTKTAIEIFVVDRQGQIIATAGTLL